MALCTLYYNDDSVNELYPVFLIIQDSNSSYVESIAILRDNLKYNVWLMANADERTKTVTTIMSKYGLNKVKATEYGFSEDASSDKMANDIGVHILEDVETGGLFSNIIKTSAEVDFWVTQSTQRAYKNQGAEGFTFAQLKDMWKVIDRKGHSSKSKEDLLEGFAEGAVEIASSNKADILLNKYPDKMIVCLGKNKWARETMTSVDYILPFISRISGSVYNKDTTPDINETSVVTMYTLVDTNDVTEESLVNTTINSIEEAVSTLKATLVRGKKE